MIAFGAILYFGFITMITGPAFDDYRARRKARQDRPVARVAYLPSAACRLTPNNTAL